MPIDAVIAAKGVSTVFSSQHRWNSGFNSPVLSLTETRRRLMLWLVFTSPWRQHHYQAWLCLWVHPHFWLNFCHPALPWGGRVDDSCQAEQLAMRPRTLNLYPVVAWHSLYTASWWPTFACEHHKYLVMGCAALFCFYFSFWEEPHR